MRRAVFRVSARSLLLALGLFGLFSVCQAETWDLKFVPKAPESGQADGKAYPQPYIFRGGSQSFYRFSVSGQETVDPAKDPELKEFRKIVTKEPTYVSKQPLKGVIRFGKQRFAFAMDVVPEEKKKSDDKDKNAADEKSEAASGDDAKKDEEKKELTKAEKAAAEKKKQAEKLSRSVFNRLYLDLNANGDLTDDEPSKRKSYHAYGSTYARGSFEASLPSEQDGKKLDIPCEFEVTIYSWNSTVTTPDGKEKTIEQRQFNASFHTTCFREGEIKLGDKPYRVLLIDYNNNGIFNDPSKVSEVNIFDGNSKTVQKQNHVEQGDIFYIFPADSKEPLQFLWPSQPGGKDAVSSLSVGGLIGLVDGKYWNAKLTASGDKLTLTPYTESLGCVEKPGCGSFTLQASNKDKKASLLLVSDENGKASVPPGEWILTNYSITFKKEKPEAKEPDTKKPDAKEIDKEAEKKAQQKKAAEALVKLLTGKSEEESAANATEATISARLPGTNDSIIKVEADKTTTLKFGEPYKVVVNSQVQPDQKNKDRYLAYLSVALIGIAGESCDDVRMGSSGYSRPPRPKFTITTKDGKEVESGAFEYG